jgi:hypothetical protein
MRYLLALLLASSVYAAGFWTLSGLDKTNLVYVQNKVSYLEASTVDTIKQKIKKTLTTNEIKVNMQDAPSMMLSLEEIVGDETHYIYLKLELGEEVKTFRDDGTETFSITYQATDFVESASEDLEEIVLESVDYLLAKFTEQLEEDKE